MLKLILQKFIELPTSVQRAFVFVLIAWVAQFATAYLYILKESIPPQTSVLGLMLFMALIFAKKWGRIMCIFFTAWAIVWYLVFFVTFYFVKRYDIMAVIAGNIALFSISIYYLWTKETAQYFEKRSKEAKAKADKAAEDYAKEVKAREKLRNSKAKQGSKKKRKK